MTVNLLDRGADTTGGTSQATASISPTANSLIIAIASGTEGDAITDYTVSTTLSGVTLDQYDDSGRGDAADSNRTWRDVGAGDTRRAKVFYGMSGAAPGSGTITFASGATAQGGWQWRVWEVTDPLDDDNNGLDSILQVIGADSDADVGTLSDTFSALAINSVALLYVVVDDEDDAVITASGYTMDTVSTHLTPAVSVRGGVENPAATTAVQPSWTGGDDSCAFIAIEIETVPDLRAEHYILTQQRRSAA